MAAAVLTGAQAVLTEVPAVPHLPTGVLQAVLPLRIEVPAAVPLTGAAGHPTAEAVLTEVPVAATPEAEFHVLPAEVPAEQSGDINYDTLKFHKLSNLLNVSANLRVITRSKAVSPTHVYHVTLTLNPSPRGRDLPSPSRAL